MGQSGWTREKRRRIREWNVYTLGAQIIPTPPDLPQGSPPAQPTLAPSSTTSTPTFPNAPSCPPSLTSSLTGHGSVTSRMWLAFGCLLCKEIVEIPAQGCQGTPHLLEAIFRQSSEMLAVVMPPTVFELDFSTRWTCRGPGRCVVASGPRARARGLPKAPFLVSRPLPLSGACREDALESPSRRILARMIPNPSRVHAPLKPGAPHTLSDDNDPSERRLASGRILQLRMYGGGSPVQARTRSRRLSPPHPAVASGQASASNNSIVTASSCRRR